VNVLPLRTTLILACGRGYMKRSGNLPQRGGEPWVGTAASLAIAAGANVKVVQTMLGHKSATMTLDLYGHLFPDQLDDVADALDAAHAAAVPEMCPTADVVNLETVREMARPPGIRGV
jgi:hypothetical protein